MTLLRCPMCAKLSPCTRCLAPEPEARPWLSGICWVALMLIVIVTNVALWRL